jgi:transposase
MIAGIGSTRRFSVFASTTPTDMRKSFDSLARVVIDELGRDPMSGDLYLFVNARCTRAKVLHWDGTGLGLYIKRLEKGRFAAPWQRAHDGSITMTASELGLFLEGSKLVFFGSLSPEQVEPNKVVTRALSVA